MSADPNLEPVRTLLQSPAPAVLATRRKDGNVKLSPVWFRHIGNYFEVVIAEGDIKLKHISRNPTVTLLIFEVTHPFRGVQVTDEGEITREHLDETRRSITSRYLGEEASRRFTEQRRGNGAVIRIPTRSARVWDLAAMTD